jgi:hypothetical protein
MRAGMNVKVKEGLTQGGTVIRVKEEAGDRERERERERERINARACVQERMGTKKKKKMCLKV